MLQTTALTVRRARTFIEVAEQGSVTRAAQVLNKSQTSVTKIIHDFEQALGVELFERSTRGVKLSAFGAAFLPKALAARAEFQAAAGFVPPAVLANSSSAARFFRMDVSDRWLDAFIATADARSIAAAGRHLGVTSAAVSASLRKLEGSLDTTLFERTSTNLEPTAFTREAIRHIKLARNYLRQGVEEIAGVKGVIRGKVVIGTLPFVRTLILPAAIIAVLDSHPELDIATTESPYDDLITGLRCGDVDFLLGALRGKGADSDVAEESLLDDDLSIIVRADHPLLASTDPSWESLLKFPWVLPRRGTPTRALVAALIAEHDLPEPEQVVETSSFVTLRGLVMDSDRVTILSRHQILREEQAGMLAVADVQLPGTARAIGLTTRASGVLSPAARLVVDEVRKVIAAL